MKNKIFTAVALKPQSFAQRLFCQHVEENAIISVNNLLATRSIQEITRRDLDVIDAHYGTQLVTDFPLNLEEFYAAYLNYCLKDQQLDLEELAELRHLKELFGLSDHTVNHLHERIGGAVYHQTFREAVSDGDLTHEEKAFLQELEETLGLPKKLSGQIAQDVTSGFLREKLAEASEDQRLSPEEEKELAAIAASLGVSLKPAAASEKQLQRMKLYWALENLELPVAVCALPLVKGEICHGRAEPAEWKKVSGRNWSVPRSSARLFDGNEPTAAVAYGGRYLEFVDAGRVYLTNRRVIFDGNDNRTSVKLEKILRVKAYRDAVEIVRESGKNPIIFCQEPGELGILIDRLVRENT